LCVVLDGPLGGGFALGRFDRTYVCQHYPRSWTLFQRVVTIGCQLSAKALVPGCAWSEHSPKGWAPPRPKPTRLGPVILRTEALERLVKSLGSHCVAAPPDFSRSIPHRPSSPPLPPLSIQTKHQHRSSLQLANDPIPSQRLGSNSRNRYRKLLSPSFNRIPPSSSIPYPRSPSAILRTRSSNPAQIHLRP